VRITPNLPDYDAYSSRNLAARLSGRQTNQRAELTAVRRALAIIPLSANARIYSDSHYSIKCVTEWFQNWEARGWVTTGKKPVENRDIIEEILTLIREREQAGGATAFEWVKGHGGDEGNEGADRLAVRGAAMAKED
jgi:ribonuclease HI